MIKIVGDNVCKSASQHTLSEAWRGWWGVKADEPPRPNRLPPSSPAAAGTGELVGAGATPPPLEAVRAVGDRACDPGLVMPASACSVRACAVHKPTLTSRYYAAANFNQNQFNLESFGRERKCRGVKWHVLLQGHCASRAGVEIQLKWDT